MITPEFLDEDNFIKVKFVVFSVAFLFDQLILFNSLIFNIIFYLSQKMVLIHTIFFMYFLYSLFLNLFNQNYTNSYKGVFMKKLLK